MSSQDPKKKSPEEYIKATFATVARRKDLVAAGCTDWELRQAELQGRIKTVAPGHFGLPHADPLDVFLAQHQGRRTCLNKAKKIGLWVIREPEQTHVAVAHGRPVPGCVVHRVRGGQTLMDILRQCVKCGTEVEALAVLESAVVLGKCTIPELRKEFSGREDTAARAIIDMMDPQSQSIAETVGRYYMRKAGYNVQGQFHVKDVGHLDLLVEGILGVETDGETYHNTPEGWEEDLRRDNLLVVKGRWCLRIPAYIVLHRPDIMMNWISQALDRIQGAQN
ncbi:hypothetical protein CVV68_06075 [Arthrobacter livingstonensis]|uniref:DUF559 domain-containing protein n=1 Tax=Arthrobacter livingstonensis TaxID=670078 RepID=A0A2V5LAM1_9MICC|nr:hypothetical protein [Arthrobacter livingstonensis]PYI68378.1 hypothetical protein CVV68_06075 [Arthrobacter livingstonensis]